MARTNSVNFTGVLQYPLADAATDLFKKEDVQGATKALDLHDHTAGKGLALPTSAIPPINGSMISGGVITSAHILDGTITTADIAGNAVQQLLGSYGAGAIFSSTVAGSAVFTPVAVSFTTGGGMLRIEIAVTIFHSASGGRMYCGLGLDGTPNAYYGFYTQSSAPGSSGSIFLTVYTAQAAGAHTATFIMQMVDAGTMSINQNVTSVMYVTEQKR